MNGLLYQSSFEKLRDRPEVLHTAVSRRQLQKFKGDGSLVAGTAQEQQSTTIESAVQRAQMPQNHAHVLCCVGVMLKDSRGALAAASHQSVPPLHGRPSFLEVPYMFSAGCLPGSTAASLLPQELQAQLGGAQKTIDSHLFKIRHEPTTKRQCHPALPVSDNLKPACLVAKELLCVGNPTGLVVPHIVSAEQGRGPLCGQAVCREAAIGRTP